jgi:hypothetical protein
MMPKAGFNIKDGSVSGFFKEFNLFSIFCIIFLLFIDKSFIFVKSNVRKQQK